MKPQRRDQSIAVKFSHLIAIHSGIFGKLPRDNGAVERESNEGGGEPGRLFVKDPAGVAGAPVVPGVFAVRP